MSMGKEFNPDICCEHAEPAQNPRLKPSQKPDKYLENNYKLLEVLGLSEELPKKPASPILRAPRFTDDVGMFDSEVN